MLSLPACAELARVSLRRAMRAVEGAIGPVRLSHSVGLALKEVQACGEPLSSLQSIVSSNREGGSNGGGIAPI